MALKIVWTDEASDGLSEIIDYIELNWSEKQVQRFFIRLEDCVESIQKAPHRYKDSLRKPRTKEFQHSPQTTLFYSYDQENIYILKLWANLKNPNDL